MTNFLLATDDQIKQINMMSEKERETFSLRYEIRSVA